MEQSSRLSSAPLVLRRTRSELPQSETPSPCIVAVLVAGEILVTPCDRCSGEQDRPFAQALNVVLGIAMREFTAFPAHRAIPRANRVGKPCTPRQAARPRPASPRHPAAPCQQFRDSPPEALIRQAVNLFARPEHMSIEKLQPRARESCIAFLLRACVRSCVMSGRGGLSESSSESPALRFSHRATFSATQAEGR